MVKLRYAKTAALKPDYYQWQVQNAKYQKSDAIPVRVVRDGAPR